uniref:Uncharacterized protein n=1 Tax=Klebsiella pneumoniae TaxID=573 RepID=A0A8B0SVS2_KLEPN|nr:hypothetical protein [Klebsiella pneumoniae]
MLQPVTIGIPTFSPLFPSGFFIPADVFPGSKLLGEIGFQRSHLRIALFSSAYFEKGVVMAAGLSPLTGAMSQIMPSFFCQSKPVFELFEKFFSYNSSSLMWAKLSIAKKSCCCLRDGR